MRKSKKRPVGRNFESYIQNEGRAQHYAYLQAMQRLAEQLESSNRTEEGNREDAERRVREIDRIQRNNARDALRNRENVEDNDQDGEKLKTYMDDETYRRLSPNPELIDKKDDDRTWYQKASDNILTSVGAVILAAEAGRSLFLPSHNGAIQGAINRAMSAKSVYDSLIADPIRNYISDFAREQRENARKEELSLYTPEAYTQAKNRNAVPIQHDDLDSLDRETQATIAQRELDYRNLIGPSDETLKLTQLAKQDYENDLLGETPNMPEGYFHPEIKHDRYGRIYYDKSPFMKDWWSQSMQNMNTAQRDNFVGMGIRYNEKKQHALDAQKYYQAQSDISDILKLADILKRYLNGEKLSQWHQDILDNVIWTDHTKTANLLMAEYDQKLKQAYGDMFRYKKDADWIESYDPSFRGGYNPKTWVEDLAKNFGTHLASSLSNGLEWFWDPSWTAGLSDEVLGLNAELNGLRDATPKTKIDMINKFILEGDRKSKLWEEGASANQEDIENWKEWHEPSDYFKFRMQTADGKFYKPSTWMYKMPEVWGSSQSSWIKQSSAMGINILGALASGGTTVAAGSAGFGLAMSSSSDENNAEVAENYRTRLKNMLEGQGLGKKFVKSNPDLTKKQQSLDDAIQEYVMDPWETGDRKIDAAVFDAMHGANSLYQDDMAAVIGDNVVDTYLQISPLAGLARAAKPSSIIKTANESAALFSTLSPGAGAAAWGVTAATTATKKALMKTAAGKAIAKQSRDAINFTKALPKRLLGDERYTKFINNAKKYNKNVFGSNSVPHRVLTAELYINYQALKDFGLDVVKKTGHSAISEGIEEGKQYIHGLQFLRGEYDENLQKELFNSTRIINDVKSGIQSAIAMSSLLPLMPAMTDDAQLIENIQSGMLGGMFQTGAQRALVGIYPTVEQIKMNDFVANEVVLEKQAQIDTYKKSKMYAKKAKDGQAAARLMLAFDRYADANQALVDNGSNEVSKEEVDLIREQKKQAQRVINLAQNEQIQSRAKLLGIDPSSDKYSSYVAAIAMFEDSKAEADQKLEDARREFSEAARKITPFTLNEDGTVVENVTLANAITFQNPINIKDADGNDLKGQALLDAAINNRANNAQLFSRIAALQSLQDYLQSTLAEGDLDNKTARDMKYQLARVKRQLRAELLNIKEEYRDKIAENAARRVAMLENGEELLDAAHKVIAASIDVDYHDAILHGIRGNLIDLSGNQSELLEDLVHSGYKHPETVIDEIEKTIDSDYKLSLAIEKDWLYQYDLLDDQYLDNLEEMRRRKALSKQEELTKEDVLNDIDDLETDAESFEVDESAFDTFDIPKEKNTNQRKKSNKKQKLANQKPSVKKQLEKLRKSSFQRKIKKTEPIPQPKMRDDVLLSRRKYISPETDIIELDGAELVGYTDLPADNAKKSSYTTPSTKTFEVTKKMQDMFAEAEDVLQQLANINELDLIDIREETAWAVKKVADDIDNWMLKTIVNKDESSVNEAEFEMLRMQAKNLFESIKEEVWTSKFLIHKNEIDFANINTLKRKTYYDQEQEDDAWKDLFDREVKYQNRLKRAFDEFVTLLQNLQSEISVGQHIQQNLLDSPTTTQVDELLASIAGLIDDSAELGIDFSEDQIALYVQLRDWFKDTANLTGNKSERIIIANPAEEVPTSGPFAGEVSVLRKSSQYGFGIDNSVAEDGTKLSDVIDLPDFLQTSVFQIEPTSHLGKQTKSTKVSLVITYNGKKFSPVTLDSYEMYKSQAGKDFWASVQKVFNLKQLSEDEILVPVRISRTIGSQRRGGKISSLLDKGLVSTSKKEGVLNLYDIEYNGDLRDFGETKTKIVNGVPVTQVLTPRTAGEIPTILHTFGEGSNKEFSGSIYMMVKRNFKEFGSDLPRVPVLLKAKALTKGDAQLIVDIITGKMNPSGISGRESLGATVYVNGENTGMTGADLISLLIPRAGTKDIGRSRVHFDIPTGTQKIQIFGRVVGDQKGPQLPREFDLATDAGRAAFVKFASENINVNVDNAFMRQRFGFGGHSNDFPFHQLILSSAIVKRLKAGETITFGKSSISVDISDVINPNDSSDERGLTGLAWMIKRGFFETDFDGFKKPNLVVDMKQGVRVENKKALKVIDDFDSGKEIKQDASVEDQERELWQAFGESFDKIVEQAKKDKLDEAKVRKNLARILGIDFAGSETDRGHVTVVDAIIDTCANGKVIGRCYRDSIILSRLGYEAGTEYHEAFHRILDVLAPPRLRSIIHRAYRSNKPNAKNKSEEEIRELLADDFMYYAINRPTFKLPHSLKEAYNMVKQYADFVRKIGSFRLYLMYALTNTGIVNKILTINKDRVKAFENMNTKGFNKIVRGVELDKVINSAMYRDLKNGIVYAIMNIYEIDPLGRDIKTLDLFFDSKNDVASIIRQKSSIYRQWIQDASVPQDTKDALEQLLDNWEVIKPDIASIISNFSTDYKVKFDEENRDMLEGDEESISGASIGEHTRASYEFSQFSRASSRVKFFFSAIPNREWGKKERNGVQVRVPTPVFVKNKAGLEEFTNANVMFNIILNKLHDCQTYDELLNGMKMLGYSDARIYHAYVRLKKIYDKVQAKKATQEEQAILTQIKCLIRSAKNEFILARSLRNGNMFSIDLQLTDADYNAQQYVRDWQRMFSSGTGAYIRRDSKGDYLMKNPYSPAIFIKAAGEIEKWSELVKDLSTDADALKKRIVDMLQSLSIQFNSDMLDYMLRSRYGSADLTGLLKMFLDPMYNILGLANKLRTFVDGNGNLVAANIDHAFVKNGFVEELANQKYSYRHAHDLLTVLATNDNRYYVMSENNYITDQIEHINRKDLQFDDLCSFSYNLYETSDPNQLVSSRRIGSVALKQKLQKNGENVRFDVLSFVGFKTDEIGDSGQDYAQISVRQDYIAKAAMLLWDMMVSPTMSDKKTWVFFRGVHLPGLNFERIVENKEVRILCNVNLSEGLIPQEVIDQFWEYAICERRSIADTLAVVKGEEGAEGRIPKLSDEEKVKNYHGRKITIKTKNGEKEVEIIQGARFASLLGVYKGNSFIEFNRILDENGNYLSEEDNLRIADQEFFSKSVEEQKELIKQLLYRQAQKELEYVKNLGLVAESGGRYYNIGLDNDYIQAVVDSILYGLNEKDLRDNPTLRANAEDFAVRAVVADICNKSIISLQEGQRILYGHPAAYEWKYDDEGHLSDLGTDLHKRLGGLISTGTNNDMEIEGIPSEYTCAEVKDKKIVSEDIEEISSMFAETLYRNTYLRKLLDDNHISFKDDAKAAEYVKIADSKPLEKIKEELGEDAVKVIEKVLESKKKAFKSVNVADGASYISDQMAENLLRMVGSWDDDVARAFKMLRGEEVDGRVYTTKDIRELAEAYENVWTSVIGSLKYTAFGLRKEANAMIPYYNKTALFPVFKCISSGHMAKIYLLMKDQGVDMVMMSSAVKLGSRGAQDIDFNNLDGFRFNTYKQRYDLLRKQFNTDPKEKEQMKIGTQSAKVAMVALTPGRNYTVNGQTYTSEELRQKIMADQNMISDLGVSQINDEFFDIVRDDSGEIVSKTLNVEKLSSILTEELTNRGASTEMLDAVSIVERDGKKLMKVPMAALSSLSWVLSILASRVNKKVVDIQTPGNAFIQRSVLGMEGPTIIDDEDMAPSINNGDRLKVSRKDNGAMECVVSIDYYENIIPKIPRRDSDGHIIYQVDENGKFVLDGNGNRKPEMMRMPFEQARKWLLDQGIIGKEPTIFAYRIPTQAISSIHALLVVDVLPVVRDTVILPAEFTAITGSDFDVDKLYLSTMFWHKGKDGKMTTEYEEGTKEHYANDLVKCYLSLLTDTGEDGKNRTAYIQHAPIDGDTKLLTDIIDDLEDIVKEYKPILPYSDLTLREQVGTKDQFIVGKFGIGPFALNNNSQILTMLYDVEFAETDRFGKRTLLSKLGLTSLHNVADRDGKSIMSWISGLINMHVDVAKDPRIFKLGVNKYTYNLTNLLVRTGLGKTTFYMLTQPIMKDLSRAYNIASGLYMQEPGVTQYRAQREATEKVIFDAYKKLDITGKTILDCEKTFKDHMFEQYKMSADQAIEALFGKGNDVLHQISKHGLNESLHVYGIEVNGTKRNLTGDEVLLLIVMAKRQFDPYAQALADLVKYSKIDTNKHGKNITEQRQYLIGYHNIFDEDSTSSTRSMFKPEGLNRMSKLSYIKKKTLNATSSFISILENQLLEATNAFQRDLSSILFRIGRDEQSSTNLLNALTGKMLAKIKSDFFFGKGGYCETEGINPKSLVSGNNTICDRLNAIQDKVQSNDEEYRWLRDNDGGIRNYLLRSLTQSVKYSYSPTLNPALGNRPDTYPNAKFIKLFNFTEEDTIDQDSIIEAWEELLNDNMHPELQQFARDLVVYAFVSSGDNGGMSDLFKYVPNSWKINSENGDYESSYAAFIEKRLDLYSQEGDAGVFSDEDIVDILQNSWYDDDIVVKMYGKEVERQFTGVTMQEQSTPSILIPKSQNIVDDIPYVFKVSRKDAGDRYSQRMYDLYIRGVINGKTVWTAIDPKGAKYKNGHYIYEMSRQDSPAADVIVSLLSDQNMLSLALQLHIPANSIEQFFTDLVRKLEEQAGLAEGLVETNILPKPIADLVSIGSFNDNPAEGTYAVPQQPAVHLPTSNTTMDIWWGSGENDPNRQNADLSNFAERPFTFDFLGEQIQLKSVEHGFQLAKLYEMYDEMDESKFESLKLLILNGTASNAKSVGKNGFKMSSTASENWDSKSSEIMHNLIEQSFKQNPQALQRLLATGNAILTHTQDKGKWGTEFPRLLMEVRDELRKEQQSAAGIQLSEGMSIKLPSALGGTTFVIEKLYDDPLDGKMVYGTLYDRFGNRISDFSESISYFNGYNDLQIFDSEGNNITSLSEYWNNSDEFSDEEMKHCK